MSIIVENNNYDEIENKNSSESLITKSASPSRRKSVHINDMVSIINIENQKKYTRKNSLNSLEIQKNTRLLEKYGIDYDDDEERKEDKCFGCVVF
jgi:hypothetical protein